MARTTDKEELEAFESLLVKVQHAQVFPKLADLGYEATSLAADQSLAATAQQKEAAEARAASLLDRLEATQDALDAVAPFGVNPARLTALRALHTAAHTAGQTQNKEAAEAQQATALYNETMAQVRLARSIRLTLTREVCKDDPDLLSVFRFTGGQ